MSPDEDQYSPEEIDRLTRQVMQLVLIKLLNGERRDSLAEELVREGVIEGDDAGGEARRFVEETSVLLADEPFVDSLLVPDPLVGEDDLAPVLEEAYEEFQQLIDYALDIDLESESEDEKSAEEYFDAVCEVIRAEVDLPKEVALAIAVNAYPTDDDESE